MKSLRTIRRKLYKDGTLYHKTLRWVNEQRKRRELPPLIVILPGKRYSIYECPIANSIRSPEDKSKFDVEARYSQVWWKHRYNWVTVNNPDYVREFMRRYDNAEMSVPNATN